MASMGECASRKDDVPAMPTVLDFVASLQHQTKSSSLLPHHRPQSSSQCRQCSIRQQTLIQEIHYDEDKIHWCELCGVWTNSDEDYNKHKLTQDHKHNEKNPPQPPRQYPTNPAHVCVLSDVILERLAVE
jgi:hypothetical protein